MIQILISAYVFVCSFRFFVLITVAPKGAVFLLWILTTIFARAQHNKSNVVCECVCSLTCVWMKAAVEKFPCVRRWAGKSTHFRNSREIFENFHGKSQNFHSRISCNPPWTPPLSLDSRSHQSQLRGNGCRVGHITEFWVYKVFLLTCACFCTKRFKCPRVEGKLESFFYNHVWLPSRWRKDMNLPDHQDWKNKIYLSKMQGLQCFGG